MTTDTKPKVLIIEGRRSSQTSISFAIGRQCACYEAETFEKGIEILKTEDIVVVLLDIKLPDVNGVDALRIIKDSKPNIEVVYLTGYASLDMAKQCIGEGAYGYLIKPFDLPDLRSVVNKAAEKAMSAQKSQTGEK